MIWFLDFWGNLTFGQHRILLTDLCDFAAAELLARNSFRALHFPRTQLRKEYTGKPSAHRTLNDT